MRSNLGLWFTALALAVGTSAWGQGSCTGLCLQQVSCPSGGSTTITGTVYTPNGTDPLPGVLVYIPNAPVDAFTPGVSCPAPGALPSGSPLVGTTTALDGTFTLTNVPVGSNIPLVIQSGRWRRQLVVSATTACANTEFSTRMPRNHTEGDIPKFAIVTGEADQVECVLLKMQVDQAEFQNPGGPGRIDIYLGNDGVFPGATSPGANGGPGATINVQTQDESALMSPGGTLNQYDVLMLPCEGADFSANKEKDKELNSFVDFANAGGRVYSSHFSYVFMDPGLYTADPDVQLPQVANWSPQRNFAGSSFAQQQEFIDLGGVATVNTSFAGGDTLSQWLQVDNATTTAGQITLDTLRQDTTGVIAPTQSWMTLNDAADGNPVMQFVYNAPVGAVNQCGRVLFNEYHVENSTSSGTGPTTSSPTFPAECGVSGTTLPPLTPQEKLLEYMLFALTDDGGQPTLTPTSADFGSEPLGFATASQTFTWTNNSTFPASATTAITTGFNVLSNNCQDVQGGGSCKIAVNFQPGVLGPQTGVLTVNSSGPSITAALTGIGTPDLNFTHVELQFGSHDVGSSTLQTIFVTNAASGTVPVPAIRTTGDYAETTTCGATLAAAATCSISITFKPATTGDRPGTLIVGDNVPTQLDGNGVDFTFEVSPASGKVVAGLSVGSQTTATPLAGFNLAISLSCTTDAPAATCAFANGVVSLSSPATTEFSVATISEYNVVGYVGLGGRGWIWLVGGGSGLLLLLHRRKAGRPLRSGVTLMLLLLVAVGGGPGLSGCSGKLPVRNASYTPVGNYTVTLTATDGFLVHSVTYSLQVTAQ